tara:strand:+ start:413 stop:589 length:177 start_codon:yes stop_codon:yes gene_type:complete
VEAAAEQVVAAAEQVEAAAEQVVEVSKDQLVYYCKKSRFSDNDDDSLYEEEISEEDSD